MRIVEQVDVKSRNEDDNETIESHLEVAYYEENKHQIVKHFLVIILTALVILWVK